MFHITIKKRMESFGKEIREITQIGEYIAELNNIKENKLIIFTVKDTSGFCFENIAVENMKKLGLNTDLRMKHGHSYAAIINKGNVIFERLSQSDESIILENKKLENEGVTINVMSSVFRRENMSVMMIDNIDYSLNGRGLNIVIYDYDKRKIEDSIVFDTHVKGNPANRANPVKEGYYCDVDNPISFSVLSSLIKKQNKELESIKTQMDINNAKMQLLMWQIFKKEGEDEAETKKRFFTMLPKATGRLRKFQLVNAVTMKFFDELCRKNNIEYWLTFGTLLGAVRNKGFIPWDDDSDVCMIREEYEKLKLAIKDDENIMTYNFHEIYGPGFKYFGHGYKIKIVGYNGIATLDIFVFDFADENVEKHVSGINKIKADMGCSAWEPRLSVIPDTKIQIRKGFHSGSKEYKICNEFFQKFLKSYTKLLGNKSKKDYIVWAIDNTIPRWSSRRIIESDLIFPLREIEFEGHIYLCPNKPEEYLSIFYGDIYSIPNDILNRHFELGSGEEEELDKVLERFGISEQ